MVPFVGTRFPTIFCLFLSRAISSGDIPRSTSSPCLFDPKRKEDWETPSPETACSKKKVGVSPACRIDELLEDVEGSHIWEGWSPSGDSPAPYSEVVPPREKEVKVVVMASCRSKGEGPLGPECPSLENILGWWTSVGPPGRQISNGFGCPSPSYGIPGFHTI